MQVMNAQQQPARSPPDNLHMLINQGSFESSASLRALEARILLLFSNSKALSLFDAKRRASCFATTSFTSDASVSPFCQGLCRRRSTQHRVHDVLCRCSGSGRFARLKLRHLEKTLHLESSPAQTM